MTIHGTTDVSDRHRPDCGERVSAAIPWDDLVRVLRSGRGREVLRYVLEANGPIEVQELVRRLADAEHDATIGSTVLELRERIHTSLCRTHLPTLEELGLVEYQRRRGVVLPTASPAEFESSLEDVVLDRSGFARLR